MSAFVQQIDCTHQNNGYNVLFKHDLGQAVLFLARLCHTVPGSLVLHNHRKTTAQVCLFQKGNFGVICFFMMLA